MENKVVKFIQPAINKVDYDELRQPRYWLCPNGGGKIYNKYSIMTDAQLDRELNIEEVRNRAEEALEHIERLEKQITYMNHQIENFMNETENKITQLEGQTLLHY